MTARQLTAADFEGDDAESIPLRGLNKNQLALATGLTLAEIDALCRNGLPGTPGKSKREGWRFDLSAVVQWLSKPQADDIDSAKRANLEATARKRRIEADKIEGKVVDLEMVERIFADTAEQYRAEVLEATKGCPHCRERIQGAVNRLASAPI